MNSAFTFKQVLNSEQSVPVIAMFWFGQILVLGYWFRAVEATACLFGVESGSTGGSMFVEPTAQHPGCQEDNSYKWRVWILDGTFDKVNDVYLWNSMWTMFSSSTSVGMQVNTYLVFQNTSCLKTDRFHVLEVLGTFWPLHTLVGLSLVSAM